jgi:hypothetical protein
VTTTLIGDLEDEVFARLKDRAAGGYNRAGASKPLSTSEARACAEATRRGLSGRVYWDSPEPIWEDGGR